MPVSVWLNSNEISLDKDRWIELITRFQSIFRSVFDFRPDHVQLWSGSFFAESGGLMISSIPLNELNEENSLDTLVQRALGDKFILKFVGDMHNPEDAKSFMVFFLRSGDRWDMPHIFFDSEMQERDLLDILWSQEKEKRKMYAYSLLDDIERIRVKLFNREHKIIDRVAISRDFPDEESIKDPGTLLYYLSGPDYRIIKDYIRNYSYKRETKPRISELNMSEAAKRIYRDKEIREIWQTNAEDVAIIPMGSLALISISENGIPGLLTKLETNVAKPFVDNIPPNLLDSILMKIKNEKNMSLPT